MVESSSIHITNFELVSGTYTINDTVPFTVVIGNTSTEDVTATLVMVAGEEEVYRQSVSIAAGDTVTDEYLISISTAGEHTISADLLEYSDPKQATVYINEPVTSDEPTDTFAVTTISPTTVDTSGELITTVAVIISGNGFLQSDRVSNVKKVELVTEVTNWIADPGEDSSIEVIYAGYDVAIIDNKTLVCRFAIESDKIGDYDVKITDMEGQIKQLVSGFRVSQSLTESEIAESRAAQQTAGSILHLNRVLGYDGDQLVEYEVLITDALARLQDLTNQVAAIEAERVQKEAESRDLQEQIDTYLAQQDELSEQWQSLQTNIESARSDLEQYESLIEEYNLTTGGELEIDIESILALKESIEADIVSMEGEKISIESQMATIESEKEAIQSEIDIINTERVNVENELTLLNQEKTSVEDEITALGNQQVELTDAIQTATQQKTTLEEDIEKLEQEYEALLAQKSAIEDDEDGEDEDDSIAMLKDINPLYIGAGAAGLLAVVFLMRR